jgi:hypothetical protein
MMALLDGHPEVVVNFLESHFFLQFLPEISRTGANQSLQVAERILLEPWQPHNAYYQKFLSHISHEQVKQIFYSRLSAIAESGKFSSPAKYLTSAVLAYGEASGQLNADTRHWVEKTPGNEHYAGLIFKWWPQAQCIHMVRDPRDFRLTFKNRALKRKRPVPRLDAVAWNWRRSVNALQENEERFGRDRYLRIRYEDLVTEPEREMGRVVAFLGISEHTTLFRPTKGGGVVSWKGNAVSAQFSEISADRAGRWRRQLDEGEVLLLEALLGKEMDAMGYRAEKAAMPGDRLRALPYRFLMGVRDVRARMKKPFLNAKISS